MNKPISSSDPEESSTSDISITTDSVSSMIEWLRGRGKILIVCHDNPDPNCCRGGTPPSHPDENWSGCSPLLRWGDWPQ